MSAHPKLRPAAAASLTAWLAVATPLRATATAVADIWRDVIARAEVQYSGLLNRLPSGARLPRSWAKGKVVTVGPSDWTSGFFPGTLWLLYRATGEAKWRAAARRYTALLAPEQFDRSTHDVGFILNCSYGMGYRLTGDSGYREVLTRGAASLASRFSPTVGCIMSWNPTARWKFPVIIDNMANLELLMWGAAHGMPEYREMAIRHADTTLRNHFRTDGSSFHVVDYDPATGRVRSRRTNQGAADSSAWARGQAWGLYGYTMMYLETGFPRYLEQARKVARFMMKSPRMPADLVPYWDFDAPDIPRAPRDAAAAAIMSSALFELSALVGPGEGRSYGQFAERQLKNLAGPRYFAQPGENGGFLLRHGTGNYPAGTEIDAPLIYADYYFLEALLRAKSLD